MEFVKNKEIREPFPKVVAFGHRLQQKIFDLGVAVYPGSGTVDGVKGDHILISPPFNVSADELELIVDALARAYVSTEKEVDG